MNSPITEANLKCECITRVHLGSCSFKIIITVTIMAQVYTWPWEGQERETESHLRTPVSTHMDCYNPIPNITAKPLLRILPMFWGIGPDLKKLKNKRSLFAGFCFSNLDKSPVRSGSQLHRSAGTNEKDFVVPLWWKEKNRSGKWMLQKAVIKSQSLFGRRTFLSSRLWPKSYWLQGCLPPQLCQHPLIHSVACRKLGP